ncbi:hypothetical protein [uncultured Thiodictyon sp.]|uniref:hypothetical protein n=1 Tax=uncultured Thiodictyon sp. TaxID=1846217 RepID=UPI0025FC878D|nr:hypothetical protein [uncultured Thiodictyon sp.]
MSGKSRAVMAFILWCLAAMPVQAAGGATAAEMMQRMEQTEKMDAKMEMVQRMDMEEELDAAKTCAGKDQFDCAQSSLAQAESFAQGPADRDAIAAALSPHRLSKLCRLGRAQRNPAIKA